jgi:hypothetical protein
MLEDVRVPHIMTSFYVVPSVLVGIGRDSDSHSSMRLRTYKDARLEVAQLRCWEASSAEGLAACSVLSVCISGTVVYRIR